MTIRRGALIGCGFFARNHMHGWAEIEGAEIVAVCDRDFAKAERMQADFSVAHAYADAEEMLRSERLDFVDVVTTSPFHRQLVELAARHGVAAICQKPFADSYADAEAMVRACEQAGVPLAVHENFRWQRPFVEIADRIAAGRIGRPTYARISFRHGFDYYKNQPYLAEVERLSLMDIGLHLYDLARHLVGEVETLACLTQRVNPIVRGEDAFTALLGHAGGAVSVVECSAYAKYDPDPFPQTTAVIEGTEGTLELTRGYRLYEHHAGSVTATDVDVAVPAWGAKPWQVVQESVVAFERHFVDVLNGRAEAQPSGAHNLGTMALALASYESAAAGSVIRIEEWREAGHG